MSLTEPIRVLHFADIHIGMENYGRIDPTTGINQRVVDFVNRLREIVDYAIANEADLVIFAGDAFKTRDPNSTYQREFARQVMRLSRAEIPTVLLVGNHDMPLNDKRATSVDIFSTLDVPNVFVGRSEQIFKIETKRGPIQVATVPWPQRSRMVQLEEHRGLSIEQLDAELEKFVADELKRLAAEADPALPAILTGHFSVSGATFGSERQVMIGRDAVIKLSELAVPAWDYVALGHIHKHQSVNDTSYPAIVYSGSLERIDFGEEIEAKGFCWVEVKRGETKWNFVPMNVRRFLSISADATEDGDTPTEAALRAIERHDVTDCIVRVRVKLLQSQEALFKPRDVEAALENCYLIAGIGKDVQRDARSRLGLDNAESLPPDELLRKYFLSKNLPPDRVDELGRLAAEIMEIRD
jgi:DNA repair protein SbcD/Mre11